MTYHQWLLFQDRLGTGYCEPEAFIEFPTRVLLVEAKLTGGPAGRSQMLDLYVPLLEALLHKPVFSLLICKWLTPTTPGPYFSGPEDFLQAGTRFGTWHFLPH